MLHLMTPCQRLGTKAWCKPSLVASLHVMSHLDGPPALSTALHDRLQQKSVRQLYLMPCNSVFPHESIAQSHLSDRNSSKSTVDLGLAGCKAGSTGMGCRI